MKKNHKKIQAKVLYKLLGYIVVSALAVIMIFPFFWMFTSAFKSSGEIYKMPPAVFPSKWQFSNISEAVLSTDIADYFLTRL